MVGFTITVILVQLRKYGNNKNRSKLLEYELAQNVELQIPIKSFIARDYYFLFILLLLLLFYWGLITFDCDFQYSVLAGISNTWLLGKYWAVGVVTI